MLGVRGHARRLLCVLEGGGSTKPSTHSKYRRLTIVIVGKKDAALLFTPTTLYRLEFTPCV